MGSLHDDLESHDAAKLLDDIVGRVQEQERPIVFLLGAGVNSPHVLGVDDVIDRIREYYRKRKPSLRRALDERLNVPGVNRYQVAFERLSDDFSADAVARVVRCAVLNARADRSGELVQRAEEKGREQDCAKLEKDLENWNLTEGMRELGKLLKEHPESFGRCVLTSNFDPCIEVSIRRARGSAITVSRMADDWIPPPEPGVCSVVHYHGHWCRSDTLHTPDQLSQPRPMLFESLREILHESTLVVIGYSGWDDAFMTSLNEGAKNPKFNPDVLWTFYDDDVPEAVIRSIEKRFESLRRRKRFRVYRGVDFNSLIPELVQHMRLPSGDPEEQPPQEQPPPQKPPPPRQKRHPLALAATGATLLVLLLGLYVSTGKSTSQVVRSEGAAGGQEGIAQNVATGGVSASPRLGTGIEPAGSSAHGETSNKTPRVPRQISTARTTPAVAWNARLSPSGGAAATSAPDRSSGGATNPSSSSPANSSLPAIDKATLAARPVSELPSIPTGALKAKRETSAQDLEAIPTELLRPRAE